MVLTTKNFGAIDVDENKIITFPDGLPGFQEEKKFIIIHDEKDTKEAGQGISFHWLQSVTDGDLSFILINPFDLIKDYAPLFDEEELAKLGADSDEDYELYNITVIPNDIQQTRVNLRAPLVINVNTRIGRQLISSNENYPLKYYLFSQTENSTTNKGR